MSVDIIDLIQEAKEWVLDEKNYGGRRTPLENRASSIIQKFVSLYDLNNMTDFERALLGEMKKINENLRRFESNR